MSTVSPTDRDLWRQVHAAFHPHRLGTDRDAQAALNRIAAKCLGSREVKPFDSANCTIRQDFLDSAELLVLKRYHDKRTPGRVHEPIVVLEYGGERWVIDGNKRVNKWIADGCTQSRLAIVITPKPGAA